MRCTIVSSLLCVLSVLCRVYVLSVLSLLHKLLFVAHTDQVIFSPKCYTCNSVLITKCSSVLSKWALSCLHPGWYFIFYFLLFGPNTLNNKFKHVLKQMFYIKIQSIHQMMDFEYFNKCYTEFDPMWPLLPVKSGL